MRVGVVLMYFEIEIEITCATFHIVSFTQKLLLRKKLQKYILFNISLKGLTESTTVKTVEIIIDGALNFIII